MTMTTKSTTTTKNTDQSTMCVCVQANKNHSYIACALRTYIDGDNDILPYIIFENTLPNKSDETNKSDKNEHKQNAQQLQCNGYTKRFPR